ncbi:MAG: sigma factor, partial [Myxococcota bacterium]
MLGTIADAEDVVQDTWLRWLSRDRVDDVRSPRAFLTTTAVRLSLDRLRAVKRRRESYVGTWLPEPLVELEPSPHDRAERAWSLSPALLIVLERLAPIERAAFLLREVFDVDYADIAATIDRTQASCRQICKR